MSHQTPCGIYIMGNHSFDRNGNNLAGLSRARAMCRLLRLRARSISSTTEAVRSDGHRRGMAYLRASVTGSTFNGSVPAYVASQEIFIPNDVRSPLPPGLSNYLVPPAVDGANSASGKIYWIK